MKFFLLAATVGAASAAPTLRGRSPVVKPVRFFRPEDWWHVETVGDTICYETTYIDANFLTQNYTLGECPDQFTVDLSSTDEVICNGRSSENVRAHSAPCKRQVARHIELPSFGRC